MKSNDLGALALGTLIFFTTFSAPAEIIDRERIRRDLAPENSEFRELECEYDLVVQKRTEGLVVGEFVRQGDYRAALVFSRLVGKRGNLGVWLNARLHDLPAPAFNGLVLDGRGTPIANLKLSEIKPLHAFDTESWVARCIDKMNRYYTPERWTELVLRQVRKDHRIDRRNESLDAFDVVEPYSTVYRQRIAVMRRLMRFFDIGGSREAWMVIRYDGFKLDEQELASIHTLVERSPVAKRVIVMTKTRLYIVDARGFRYEDLEYGESRLAPGERSFLSVR